MKSAPGTISLNAAQRAEVAAATAAWLRQARMLYRHALPDIQVRFDLHGCSAGMYRVRGERREIRYNPLVFAHWYAENLAETVPHEVAHYVVDMIHGRSARPHGPEWCAVMAAFGVAPRRTSDFDLSALPLRRERRFAYRCACGPQQLSATRHNRVRRGQSRYRCRACGEELRPDRSAGAG